MHHIAKIPTSIIEDVCQQYLMTFLFSCQHDGPTIVLACYIYGGTESNLHNIACQPGGHS